MFAWWTFIWHCLIGTSQHHRYAGMGVGRSHRKALCIVQCLIPSSNDTSRVDLIHLRARLRVTEGL